MANNIHKPKDTLLTHRRFKSSQNKDKQSKGINYLHHGRYQAVAKISATKLCSLTVFASAILLAGCQQNSSTDTAVNDNSNSNAESSLSMAYTESSAIASDSDNNAQDNSAQTGINTDTDNNLNNAERIIDTTNSHPDEEATEETIKADKVTFHARPLDYELPKQVAERCVAEPKEGEIGCPEVDVALAEVEPKWIEQVINLDITGDNSANRTKFYQELDAFTTSQVTDEIPISYHMQITPEQEASYKNVAQFSIFRDLYMGGAHGMPTKYYLLFDMDLQSQIDLDDVITDEQAFYNLAYDAFRIYLKKEMGLLTPEEIADYEQFWTFVLPQSFYFNDTGVVLMYQPYEIGSYAQGFIELTVAYEDLHGILKPKYMP